jgi:hypothetical protein
MGVTFSRGMRLLAERLMSWQELFSEKFPRAVRAKRWLLLSGIPLTNEMALSWCIAGHQFVLE